MSLIRAVRIVACAPLAWLALTLAGTFLLAPWWNLAGDVMVTWNVIGVFGLLLTVPGAMVVLITAPALHVRLDRWFATGGLVLLLAFCAWMFTVAFDGLTAPPQQFDQPSMLPELSAAEYLIFTAPYVVLAVAIAWVLVRMWREVSRRARGATPNEPESTPRSSR